MPSSFIRARYFCLALLMITISFSISNAEISIIAEGPTYYDPANVNLLNISFWVNTEGQPISGIQIFLGYDVTGLVPFNIATGNDNEMPYVSGNFFPNVTPTINEVSDSLAKYMIESGLTNSGYNLAATCFFRIIDQELTAQMFYDSTCTRVKYTDSFPNPPRWHDFDSLWFNFNSNFNLPVEFSVFYAVPDIDKITLIWITQSETDNDHFVLHRRILGSLGWMDLAMIQGAINSSTPIQYQYQDNRVTCGNIYQYYLTAVDINGVISDSTYIVESSPLSPDKQTGTIQEYQLYPNYPNPFNESTIITYYLPSESYINIIVYNILGEKIVSLFQGPQVAGNHRVAYQPKSISSGVYICELSGSDAMDPSSENNEPLTFSRIKMLYVK